jgi:EAL domain-containing protein (putative c-di-GMP-specific phosphodiesterase class I)
VRLVIKEPEAHMIELLNAIQDKASGWSAVCFGFSKLLEHYRSEYQIKIATNLINDLLGDRDGAIHLCEDSTIYVMVRNFSAALHDKMIFQLRYLFMDDPLAYGEDGDENPAFATSYNLESQWQDFMDICKRRLVQRVRKTQADQRAIPRTMQQAALSSASTVASKKIFAPADMGALHAGLYFNAASLPGIERDLQQANIRAALRRQPVCAYVPGQDPRTVFSEIYINIAHLRHMLNIDIDIASNRWLFKYLTQVLDDKMLALLQDSSAEYLSSPVSINVNIATLLSNRFAEFDASIKPAAKVSIVMELQISDVFSDMAAFMTAKDIVQKLGYRVCLDGVTDLSFPHLDRQKLGFDLIKLQWNADTETENMSEKTRYLADAIKRAGSTRVILTRCDNDLAVQYGRSIGISLYQGRYLDGMVNPNAMVEN